ncbi:hypothetical protein [Sphingomonas sp. DT-204]|uniref:hypothetical protein n=1 Tax=Sphingomonas sp. DT-204 TaxID=3396166 RepID=UPI003F1CD5F3
MAFRNLTGCAVATITAGPVFVANLAAATVVASPGPVAATPNLMPALLILPLSAVIGAIVAFIPVTIGTMAMGWLGERNPAVQLPVAWALAGAAMAAGWIPLVPIGREDAPFIFALAMTGAIAALFCRHWLVWAPRPRES